MFRKLFALLLILFLVGAAFQGSYGWGVWGHQHINRAAIFALPEPLRSFYFNHADFITVEASIPDVRKYTLNDRDEGPRHYIDLEAYGERPFDSLPHLWDDAVRRYGKSTLYKNGILPWYIALTTDKLTTAFRQHDKVRILLLSADLAHYIGDAYMPLHTSLNHDGQLTGQRGVHALWESLLPEMFGEGYNLHTTDLRDVGDPQQAAWDILQESHALVIEVLTTEKKLLDSWPQARIYASDSQGQIRKNRYGNPWFSDAFATAYHQALHGMVERQMRLAIASTASFWYTAWVNAGRPDLSVLDDPYTYRVNSSLLKSEYRLWTRQGKLVGVRPQAEF